MSDCEQTFEKLCHCLGEDTKNIATRVLGLNVHSVFDKKENYIGQHTETKANVMLAYRHLEDARTRIGKIFQAADG